LPPADLLRLTALGAIWGASFIFIRVLAPAIGPWPTAASRVLLGGLVLVAYAAVLRRPAELARHGRAYVVIGLVNSAIPFVLFGYAALHLPASYLAILNSATPLFAALLASAWLAEPLTVSRSVGLVTGCAGVALVTGTGPVRFDPVLPWAVAASLLASFCYAASGIYLRRRAPDAPSLAVAGWSQLAAGIVLLPFALATLPAVDPALLRQPVIVLDLLALAVVCSALAYLLYYRLMRDVGPTRTFTVTFLIPLFGMLWGSLFLQETITLSMLAGCGLVIAGTVAVLRPAGARRAT
jgi:drug/metabolite transporter (DMT)-like permease